MCRCWCHTSCSLRRAASVCRIARLGLRHSLTHCQASATGSFQMHVRRQLMCTTSQTPTSSLRSELNSVCALRVGRNNQSSILALPFPLRRLSSCRKLRLQTVQFSTRASHDRRTPLCAPLRHCTCQDVAPGVCRCAVVWSLVFLDPRFPFIHRSRRVNGRRATGRRRKRRRRRSISQRTEVRGSHFRPAPH